MLSYDVLLHPESGLHGIEEMCVDVDRITDKQEWLSPDDNQRIEQSPGKFTRYSMFMDFFGKVFGRIRWTRVVNSRANVDCIFLSYKFFEKKFWRRHSGASFLLIANSKVS